MKNRLRLLAILFCCAFTAGRAAADINADFLAAVSSGDTNAAAALLVQGADVNSADGGGRPALVCAADHGDVPMLQLLLDRYAAVEAKDKKGSRTALLAAAMRGSAGAVRLLIQYTADPNGRGDGGLTPLMAAVGVSADTATFNTLLLHGARVKDKDDSGKTVLMYAVANAYFVKALLDAGAPIDAQDKSGRTALMAAARGGFTETTRLLLARGADPGLKDKEGHTAMQGASQAQRREEFTLLSASGAAALPARTPANGAAAAPPDILGLGPELQAEQDLREAYIRFFEQDPANRISAETARYLRQSSATIALRNLNNGSLAEGGWGSIVFNLSWLPLLYGTEASPYNDERWLQAYRKGLMAGWLNNPELLNAFVRRTAELIVHEAGHCIYDQALPYEPGVENESNQDIQCRYRQVLFLRSRLRSDPGYLDLKSYDALMRDSLKEPAPAGPWWADPLPDALTERRVMELDRDIRLLFPGRFDYSLEWSWYRLRLLNGGLESFRRHIRADVQDGPYEDPAGDAGRKISKLKRDIDERQRWLEKNRGGSATDGWLTAIQEQFLNLDRREVELDQAQMPSKRYRDYFELESARLEGLLAQELMDQPPGPRWLSPAIDPPLKRPPPLRLKSLLGAPVSSIDGWEALRGNVVVLEFWATWCSPCREAIAHINALAREFRGMPIRFISVTDEPSDGVKRFLRKTPLKSWTAVDAERSLLQSFEITSIPNAILVDAQGNWVESIDPRELTPRMLRNMLAGRRPGPAKSGSIDLPAQAEP